MQLSHERRERLLAHFKTAPTDPSRAVEPVLVPIRGKARRDWSWAMSIGLAATFVAVVGGALLFSNGLVRRKAAASPQMVAWIEHQQTADATEVAVPPAPPLSLEQLAPQVPNVAGGANGANATAATAAPLKLPGDLPLVASNGYVVPSSISSRRTTDFSDAVNSTPPATVTPGGTGRWAEFKQVEIAKGQQLNNKTGPAILQDMANVSSEDEGMRELLEKHGYSVKNPPGQVTQLAVDAGAGTVAQTVVPNTPAVTLGGTGSIVSTPAEASVTQGSVGLTVTGSNIYTGATIVGTGTLNATPAVPGAITTYSGAPNLTVMSGGVIASNNQNQGIKQSRHVPVTAK